MNGTGWHIRLLSLLLLLSSLHIQAQQKQVNGRVVDAETGDPLPYVTIYLGPGRGTLTNEEGNFSICAVDGEVVTIQSIGYKTVKFVCSELPKNISLTPLSQTLNEVTVHSIGYVLDRVYDILKGSLKRGKNRRSTYFFRTVEEIGDKTEMVEAFVDACPAVHLSDISILSGRQMQLGGIETSPSLKSMNLYHYLELGPMMGYNDFWFKTIWMPFDQRNYRKHYNWSYVTQHDEDGRFIYRIRLKRVEEENGHNYIDGEIVVDGHDYQPIRFQGTVHGMPLMTGNGQNLTIRKVDTSFFVDYTPEDGYSKVSHVHFDMNGEGIHAKAILYGVDNMDLGRKEGVGLSTNNLITSIREVGFDSLLWTRNGILQRTALEEKIAFGSRMAQEYVSPVDTMSVSNRRLKQIVRMVDTHGKKYPQEMVYVHMDNTNYYLGDTIFYKAYVQQSNTRKPSHLSKILYAELWNQDGYLQQRQMLHLENGQAVGSFGLPDSLYAGFYELRVYTRWQLNWGVTEHPHSKNAETWFLSPEMAKEYFRDYEKIYSRVFPVYDKPQEDGLHTREMTPRLHRRYFKEEQQEQKAVVKLYPEGGAWVEGVPQQLAFEATDEEGKHLDGQLVFRDGTGRAVCTGHTEHRGRGTVKLSAQKGEEYSAEFLWGKNNKSKVELPPLETAGAAMQVAQRDSMLFVEIHRSHLDGKSLGIALTLNGMVLYASEVQNDTLSIHTGGFPMGVVQLTLFDDSSQVVADRLLFLRKQGYGVSNIGISGLSEKVDPLSPFNIQVKSSPRSVVSVAIRDTDYADANSDNGSIMTEMLLGSQVRGFVDNPGYYFEKDDSIHHRHLDLLLMVQGWRRFQWKDATGEFSVREPAEQTPSIRGEVYTYKPLDQEDYFYVYNTSDFKTRLESSEYGNNRMSGGGSGPILREPLVVRSTRTDQDSIQAKEEKKTYTHGAQSYRYLEGLPMEKGSGTTPDIIYYTSAKSDPKDFQSIKPIEKDVNLHACLLLPQQKEFVAELDVRTEEGKFSFELPSFEHETDLLLKAGKGLGKKTFRTGSDGYPEYSIRICPFYPRFTKPYSYYQTHLDKSQSKTEEYRKTSGDVTELAEIVTGARKNGLRGLDFTKPAFSVDAYEAFNSIVDAGLSPAWFAGSQSFSIQLSRMYLCEMGVLRPYELERRWNQKNLTDAIVPTLQYQYNNLENLQRVTFYTDYAPRQEGNSRYKASDQPSVTLNFERPENDEIRLAFRDRYIHIPGFAQPAEFYSPDYSQHKLPEGQKDYRRTLYWNPNLQLDEKGEAHISFYNNSRTTKIVVDAEGQAADGTLLWYK